MTISNREDGRRNKAVMLDNYRRVTELFDMSKSIGNGNVNG